MLLRNGLKKNQEMGVVEVVVAVEEEEEEGQAGVGGRGWVV